MNMMTSSLANEYGCFAGANCLHFQSRTIEIGGSRFTQKRLFQSIELHGVTPYQTAILLLTVVRTSNSIREKIVTPA
jgi:hypothetical protein